MRFRVDLRKGQKTGLFLDQRENHLAARQYARGRVLDGFTYDGGFALQVARQADEVMAVDLSAEALERVKANAALNGLANVTTRDANVFDLLKELDQRGERFDTVILDPPAFAKSKDAVEKAAPRLQGDQPPRPQDPEARRDASSPARARTTSTRRTSRRSWPTPRWTRGRRSRSSRSAARRATTRSSSACPRRTT